MPYDICQRWLANDISNYIEQLISIFFQNICNMVRDDDEFSTVGVVIGLAAVAVLSPAILLGFGGFAVADAVSNHKWRTQVQKSYNVINSNDIIDTKLFLKTLLKFIDRLKQYA